VILIPPHLAWYNEVRWLGISDHRYLLMTIIAIRRKAYPYFY